MTRTTIHTVGHGTRRIDAFVAVLRAARIAELWDVRAKPASRRHPHFAKKPLSEALEEAGIAYAWEGKDLGGFRTPKPESRHTALSVDAFRGYAEWMETRAFERAVARLVATARERRVAVMCAERFPTDCHRTLLSDWLVAHGARVVHLIEPGQSHDHELNEDARLDGGVLVYDGGKGRQLTLGW
jgi:uncharacterized protein (DUF488 family)